MTLRKPGSFPPALSFADVFSDYLVFDAVIDDNVPALAIPFAGDFSSFVEDNGRFHDILQYRPPLLCVCCFFGSCQSIHFALTRGADLSKPDRRGRKWFHFAAAGNQARVFAILGGDSDPDLLAPDEDGMTALHHAAETDAVEVFEWYLDRFRTASIFNIETHCGTPLHCACRKRALKCFRFLVQLNIAGISDPPIDFNLPLGRDHPLLLLLAASAYELIPLGVRAGLAIDGEDGDCPPIIEAAARGNTKFVREICRRGADVNKRDAAGRTAFFVAAMPLPAVPVAPKRGRLKICKMLIKAGAIVHYIAFGRSPFQSAGPEGATFIRMLVVPAATRGLVRNLLIQKYAEIDSKLKRTRSPQRWLAGCDDFPFPEC